MVVILIAVLATMLSQHPETMSLLGEPLYAPPLAKADRQKAESALEGARHAYDQKPSDVEAIVAFERANLALGRVGDALEILTHGLEANPDNARLLLERGRGYITIRKFEVAARDLRTAAAALPEAKCALGLAQYLSSDFSRAADSFGGCADPGVFGYLADHRAGGSRTTRPAVSDTSPAGPPAIRFPGSVTSGRAKQEPRPMAAEYLDAIERLLAGDQDGARERLKKLVEQYRRSEWMEPVYIAAEADYARVKKPDKRRKQ